MACTTRQSAQTEVWDLARRQHGVVSRGQLRNLGFSRAAIHHRIERGRLHPVTRGVYAVGRRELSREGWWMAAVLACGPGSRLSHGSAAALWGCGRERRGIEVSVLTHASRARPGITIHRRPSLDASSLTSRNGIPVTTVACTLVDLAARGSPSEVERAVNEADKLGLTDPESLRASLGEFSGRRGVRRLRHLLDRHTFVLTDSELERRFVPIARSAGLPPPLTGAEVNGFKVDFFWPDLGLVLETDGLTYHRTPAAQARDRLRDQAHTAAGFTVMRFTHHQIRHQPGYVRTRLAQTARHLTAHLSG